MSTEPSANAPDLLSRQDGGVLHLTINREARRNAMSPAVVAGLTEALSAANDDRSLRAIVLTGAGEKAFAPAPTWLPASPSSSTIPSPRRASPTCFASVGA